MFKQLLLLKITSFRSIYRYEQQIENYIKYICNQISLYSYMNEPNCTVACIERNDDIYCNPRCDLPQELKGCINQNCSVK